MSRKHESLVAIGIIAIFMAVTVGLVHAQGVYPATGASSAPASASSFTTTGTSTALTFASTAGSGVAAVSLSTTGAKYCLNSTCTTYIWNNGANVTEFVNGGTVLLNTSAITGSVGNPSTNPGFVSHAASGSNAFAADTNGARFDYGAGASDYASSDGTTVTFFSPLVASPLRGTYTPTGTTSPGISSTAPTISSGFGTSPSVVASNGTLAFEINVGTGGTASSGAIGLPAAVNGWNCQCTDITTASATVFVTKQTASTTTTCTVGNFNTAGAAAAWAASDKLRCIAAGY